MRVTPILPSLFIALAGFASAQVINVDFDASSGPASFTGLAAAPDPSGAAAVWTGLTRTGNGMIHASNLVDSAGNATGVGLSLDVSGSYFNLPGDQELGSAGAFEGMMADYVFLSAASSAEVFTKTGSITGLDADRYYEVYLYGQGDEFTGAGSAPGQNTLFTIGGVSQQTNWDTVIGGNGLLEEGVEYVRFLVQASSSGQIAFSWSNVVSGPGGNVTTDLDGTNSRYAALNAIQIVEAVPEPSAALLGGIGLLILIQRRRLF